MPLSIIVGGQYGSEGKGKVAYLLARQRRAAAVIRVGGPNSGHTAIGMNADREVLRQLPTAALLPNALCVIAAGSYVDPHVLLNEIRRTRIEPERLIIDPAAFVVTEDDKRTEREAGLGLAIGSTLSGTGAAVRRRVGRSALNVLARDVPELRTWVSPATEVIRTMLDQNKRILIEGTQGFGLSLLHGGYPFVTSRDTTAAGILAEAGLSPLDVDEVVLVVRAFPIRVGGNSGPLPSEIDWETVALGGNHDHRVVEYTTVTGRLRRVAKFDSDIVVRAIQANRPTLVVLNHLDYLDHESCTAGRATSTIRQFVSEVELAINHRVDCWGLGPSSMEWRDIALSSELVSKPS